MVVGLLLAVCCGQAPAAAPREGQSAADQATGAVSGFLQRFELPGVAALRLRPAGEVLRDPAGRSTPDATRVEANVLDLRPTCPIGILRPDPALDPGFTRSAPLVDPGMSRESGCAARPAR
jgi:hypothetical protein